ncbi:MAG: sigma-54-dependent transcriptional regulator [Myxococcota bacterium]
MIDREIGRRRSDRIVGAARATQEIIDQAMAAARGDLPVVLAGPEGSGKAHTARAIHAWSDRLAQRFVVVSCAAVSELLLSREIFGAADGVYPLLAGDYAGALALAESGTVLISGVERLPATVRQALVDAIKTGGFHRDGEQVSAPLRARIMVTTTGQPDTSPLGDLPQHTIRTASLAERPEDILPLAAHFLRLYADEEGIQPVGFTADARNAMMAEDWPGNVRELSERIRQAVKLAGNGSISAEALILAAEGENVPSFKEAKRAFETRYVVGLLRRCGGNISRAARLAKKDRKDFYDVIRRTGVNPADFR